jgi:phage tail sheath gpL-like
MAISFDTIPSNIRVPWAYIEFNNKGAVQGPQLKAFKNLVITQKLASGTNPANTLVRITNADQAGVLGGSGSLMHRQAQAWFKNNTFSEVFFFPLTELVGGTQAAGSISFTGPATKSGILYLYIDGDLIQVGITSGDIATAIATKVVTAVTAATGCPLAAEVDGTDAFKVNFTALGKGTYGNEIPIMLNINAGDETPAGVGTTIVAMTGGAGNPDISPAIAAMGSTQYEVIVMPYLDGTNMGLLDSELDERFGPTKQIDGYAFAAKSDTLGNLSTFGNTKNSKYLTVMGSLGSPSAAYKWSAAVAAVAAQYLSADPARPLQTLLLSGIIAPLEANRFTMEERNLLLYDGISTFMVDAGGQVRIERVITTYQKNEFGADDISYLNIETMYTLSYLRWSFRNTILSKYPRHKLGNDGTKYGTGQAIMTPKVGKAEAIALFRQWEELGLVENVDSFIAGLVVERNISDPDRLDWLITPDVMNQFRIAGVQIRFLL